MHALSPKAVLYEIEFQRSYVLVYIYIILKISELKIINAFNNIHTKSKSSKKIINKSTLKIFRTL